MEFRDLTKEEKDFLKAYTDKVSNVDESRRAVELIREANVESLFEVVVYGEGTDICATIASYLNDNADRLGFTESCAVEKMARVKRSPWALNQFRFTPEEQKWVVETQTKLLTGTMVSFLQQL